MIGGCSGEISMSRITSEGRIRKRLRFQRMPRRPLPAARTATVKTVATVLHGKGRAGGGPAAIAPRRRGVRLDPRLVGDVLLESRNLAIRHRCLDLRRGTQQLVADHDPREAQDVELVANFRVRRVAKRERRHVGGVELQEREVAPRHALAGDRRAVPHHCRGQSDAIRKDHGDRRVELDLRPANHRRQRLLADVAARAAHAVFELLVGDRLRRQVGRRDDVSVCDHPSVRSDEPPGAGLAKGRGNDALLTAGRASHHDLGRDLRDDERDGGLGAKQRLLNGKLRTTGNPGNREEKHARDPLAHRPRFYPAKKTARRTKQRLQGATPGALSLPPRELLHLRSYFIRPIASMAFAFAASIFPALQAASASRTSLIASPPLALAPAIERGACTSCVLLRGAWTSWVLLRGAWTSWVLLRGAWTSCVLLRGA